MQDDDGKSVVLMKYENNWIGPINIVENWTGKMQITCILIPNAIRCYCTKLSNMTNMGTYCFKHTIPPFHFIDKVIIYTWLLIGFFAVFFFFYESCSEFHSICRRQMYPEKLQMKKSIAYLLFI